MPRSGLSQVRPAVKGASDDQLARQERLPFRSYAALAQVVEHIIRNDGVRGSSPLSGTTTLTLVPSRLLLEARNRVCPCGYGVGGT